MLNFGMKEMGIQTDPLKVFEIRATSFKIKKMFGFPHDLKNIKNSEDITMDIEDHLIDKLLNERIITSKNSITNSWVKSPFCITRSFSVMNGKLYCHVSPHFNLIKERCASDQLLKLSMEHLETAFVDILQNRKKFLTKFNKIKYRGYLSLAQGFALFLIWFSDLLHDKISGHVICFISLLYLCVNAKQQHLDINLHFIENYIKNKVFPDIKATEDIYKRWLNQDVIFYIDSVELVGFLSDYFKGIDIQKFRLSS